MKRSVDGQIVSIFLHYRTLYVVYLAGLAFIAVTAPVVHAVAMEDGGIVRMDPVGVRWMGMGLAVVAMILAAVSALALPKLTSATSLATRSGMRQAVTVATALYRALVLRVLFAEAIAIFGLVLFLVTGNLSTLYGFLAPGIILILIALPRYTQWVATIEAVRQLRKDWQAEPGDPG